MARVIANEGARADLIAYTRALVKLAVVRSAFLKPEVPDFMAHSPRHRQESDTSISRRVQTEGVFRKCDACGESVPVMSLRRNLDVCTICGHHFQITALRRIELTLDPDSFNELFGHLE